MSPRPRYVDFHCHLDLYPDLAEAIQACESAETATLAVTTTPKAFRQNLQRVRGSKFVRVGLGLHPQVVAERWSEMALFEALLPETRYVGEIGLDAGPRFFASIVKQVEIFRRILALCAGSRGKILSIHSVRSASKVLDHLDELFPASAGRAVLHWFTGTRAEIRRATALGCYFSVNQAMFKTERGAALISEMPLDRILTETDGPFVEIGDRSIAPGSVAEAIRLLGECFSIEVETMRERVVSNFAALLGEDRE